MTKHIWTPSKVDKFKTCPRQFEAMYVTKEIEFKQNDHARFGELVHKQIEDYIKYQKPMHKLLEPLKQVLDDLKPFMLDAELKLAINTKGKATSYWDKNAWQRCIVDAILMTPDDKTVILIDWKTGKEKEARIQSDMTAACAFAKYIHAERVVTVFAFLFKGGGVITTEYTRDEPMNPETVFHIQAAEDGVKNNNFPPKPSGLCGKWCDVLSCEHNGKRK